MYVCVASSQHTVNEGRGLYIACGSPGPVYGLFASSPNSLRSELLILSCGCLSPPTHT